MRVTRAADLNDFAKPTPVLQMQRKADAQTVEHDLRRSHIAILACRLFDKTSLPLDKGIAFGDASFRFQQLKHALFDRLLPLHKAARAGWRLTALPFEVRTAGKAAR